MKKLIGITTAALLTSTMIATPLLAQTDIQPGNSPLMEQTNPGSSMDSGMQRDTLVDSNITGAIDADVDTAISALSASTDTAAAISAMTDTGKVNVISLAELEDEDTARLEQAVSGNEAAVQELRTAVDANAALSSELDAQGVMSSDIVAAQATADGGVIVYVR